MPSSRFTLEEQREHVAREIRVERAGRLVEQQELGAGEQRAPERDALALAAREVGDAALEERAEAQDSRMRAPSVAASRSAAPGAYARLPRTCGAGRAADPASTSASAAPLGRRRSTPPGRRAERAPADARSPRAAAAAGRRRDGGATSCRSPDAPKTPSTGPSLATATSSAKPRKRWRTRASSHIAAAQPASRRRWRAESQKEPRSAAEARASTLTRDELHDRGLAVAHVQQRVDGDRDRARLALDVAGEHDRGAELAERAREAEHRAGERARAARAAA